MSSAGRSFSTPLSLGSSVSLVGRRDLLASVTDQLLPGRVVTLTGLGGVGKTSLAMQVAAGVAEKSDRLTDGVWICQLTSVTDPEAIPIAVADAIGMVPSEGASGFEMVVSGLSGLRGLLVLDNCEHLTVPTAAFLHRLLAECPALAVLVTSREPVRVSGEHIVDVPLLDAASAQELFVQRAIEANPRLAPSAHHSEIEKICDALDGLPLALELAAARLSSMTVVDVAERLDERFRILRTGGGTGRHDSLHATVSWSYELLEPIERRLFDRISVFQSSFDDDAATALMDPRDAGADVREVLSALVDKSMVVLVPTQVEHTGKGRRYAVPETLRHFGDRQLARRTERAAVRNQHLDYMVGVVAAANALVLSDRWEEGAARFAAEWPNIRAAVNWAIDTTRVADVDRLLRDTFFYCRWALESESAEWARRAIDRGPTTGAHPGAPAHMHVAFRQFLEGAHDAALASLETGLKVSGTPSDRGWCRHYAAVELLYLGRADEAADRATTGHDDESPRPVEGIIRSSAITTFEMYAGRTTADEVGERQRRDAELARATGNAVAIGQVSYNSAICALDADDVDAYLQFLNESLEVARRHKIANLVGYVLTARVHAHGASGLRTSLEALEYWGEQRDLSNECVVLDATACNLAEQRRFEPAAIIFGNLAADRRQLASAAVRRAEALAIVHRQRKSTSWLETGASMSRSDVLEFARQAIIDALKSLT